MTTIVRAEIDRGWHHVIYYNESILIHCNICLLVVDLSWIIFKYCNFWM